MAAFAVAGALAVPLHPVATPVSAIVAWLLGALASGVWRWSRLPDLLPRGAQQGLPLRILQSGLWIVLGFAVGLLLLGVIRMVIQPVLPAIGARITAAGALPLWRRALIIYVAAVGEELMFRLLLFSAVAGFTARLLRVPDRVPNGTVVWIANVVTALAFATVHLPAWVRLGPTTPGLAVSVLSLNLVGALVLGHVFATRGIVAAIWTHAGADCAIQLVGPFTS